MKEIDGKAKNIRGLLTGTKYSIDYYQREYRWRSKQINELIEDLTSKFLESYEKGQDRSEVEHYGHYFLGSIVVSDRDGQKFVIDGQQRLTSVTLLLIFLHHHLKDTEQKGQISELIFSQKYGVRSFNLNVEERTPCMESLYSGDAIDESDQPESVVNILGRYHDIVAEFPDDILSPNEAIGDALPYFADWLIENVHLVEITAYSDEDAYSIFETMNDRGLSLTPTDMLKGYLLANITTPAARASSSMVWKKQINELQDLGKEEDSDAIKAWLRSQYAESIRERKAGAVPRDFDLIGTEFHRWIREEETRLGLTTGSDFAKFIDKNFAFYSNQYLRIRKASQIFDRGLERIFYNAQYSFTLQFPVLLAPLQIDDSETEILRKIRVASAYIDILIARRIWNFRAIDYSTMQYAMFIVIKEIRNKSAKEIGELLQDRLAADPDTFASNPNFRLHGTNGRQIHRLLARLTAYLECSSGLASRYVEYVDRHGKTRYEIEHIWANHPERHAEEFAQAADFQEYRNRIGGLLLLPKKFNASYGDLS